MNRIQDLILIKVNARKCITARTLLSELISHNTFWTKSEIRHALVELSEGNFITEIELQFADHTNESIFVPKATKVNLL